MTNQRLNLKNNEEENYVNVLGVPIDPLSIPSAIDYCEKIMSEGRKGYITLTGVHGVIESQLSTQVREAHQSSLLSLPDGMPLVWIGRLKGFINIKRCYGPDVFYAMLKDSKTKYYSHFFYGGAPKVANELKQILGSKFPWLKIVGTYSPPFRNLNLTEEKEFINLIKKLKPDIIWVGLSTPKQELFMKEFLPKLNTKLMFGIGAAFDFYTGRVKQAPKFIQKSGFEWLFRLLSEPKRLWKRYSKIIPIFIWMFSLQSLGLKHYILKKETGVK